MKTINPLGSGTRDLDVICGRDKSLTHRAIMFSAMATGVSQIHHPLMGADCLSTMECFRQLGVEFLVEKDLISVNSKGYKSFISPPSDLDCGNSGTTARLLLGLLAGIESLKVTLIGDESLSKRPMDRVIHPLTKSGALYTGPSEGRYLPITVTGRSLVSSEYTLDKATAQVKSALILASLQCAGTTIIKLPKGSRDHTENMLKMMGASCHTTMDETTETVSFTGPFDIPPHDYRIPVDPSSAAFFAVLGLLRKGGTTTIPSVLDNPTRTGFVSVLKRMSQNVKIESALKNDLYVEPIITIKVKGSGTLQGTRIEKQEVPTLVDEIPILAVIAAFATGLSRFCGLAELRVKESDRLSKTLELLQKAGVDSFIENDDLVILGGLTQANCFQFDSEGDHRLAMAGAIMAKFAGEPCQISQAECVDVSFPTFYEELDRFES